MFPKHIFVKKGNRMEDRFKMRGKSFSVGVGDNFLNTPFPKLHFITKVRKRIVTVTVFLLLFSFCLPQFLFFSEAVDPSEDHLGSEIHKTTWTFENAPYFNTTETTIADGEVKLKSYNYTWNQTSRKDFERGITDNVTLTQKSITVDVESWNFESGDGGWERGIISGGKNQWQYGDVSVIPEFIGTHDSGKWVWGTNLGGKYDDSGGTASDYFLKSPIIDLTDYENIEMSFWHYYDFENDIDFFDGGRVEVSIDNGMSWQPISPLLGYDGPIVSEANPLYEKYCFAGNSTAWVEERFDLPPQFDGVQNFRIRFHFATNGQISDYGWYIDDIKITSTKILDGEVELDVKDIIEVGNPPANIIQRPANETVIDINNPVNADGTLTKWTVYTATNGSGKMKIFRDVGGEFVFVNETELENVTRGENTFDCLIDVNAGDYIGWYGENAEIFAESGGSAFSKPGDIKEPYPISNWISISYNLSIRAVGMSRYPVGIFTSQVLNAGSSAIWEEIKWGEDLSHRGVDIILQTRTGNSLDTTDSSWDIWSLPLSKPNGSSIESPYAQYIQLRAKLSTAQQPYTPTLYYVSISYRKYSPYGDVETRDFIPLDDESKPKVVVQWIVFSADEKLNGQNIDYNYSLDSGETWHSIPENGDLSSVSVLGRKIRFKAGLSAADTTVSPVIGEISLFYSCATPNMWLSIGTDKNKAKPGDIISYTIYYDNRDIGDAKNVSITFEFDANLSYVSDDSPVSSTIENGNVRKWHFETVKPGNRTFTVVTKVKEISKETTISTSAVLNYTDIGGNPYPFVMSNDLTIKVKISQDFLPYYLLIGAIIAIIIISFMFLVAYRLRSKHKAEEKIALKDVERGIGYLLMEENPTKSYTLFSDLIDRGYEGVCITRTFPGRVLTNYYFEGVSLLWLSRARDENSILPTNLGAVLRNAKDFMDQNENAVVLLDGLEYLIVHNDFQRVLKLVHGLNELAAINDAVLIMPLNPLTLDKDKVALLKRDLKVIG